MKAYKQSRTLEKEKKKHQKTYIHIALCDVFYDHYTLQPLYNTVRYNTVLDITWFKDGSQKCIYYIEI